MEEEKRTIIASTITMNHEDVDWLSCLPDSILTDILSRLRTEEVVQTCILSKRWRNLWTFVPCMNFRYTESKSEETEEKNIERFENFVNMFLLLRDNATDLHSFTLWHPKSSNSTIVKRWILYALKHNPKKLHIMVQGHNQILLPECFFTCESLKDIYLSMEMKEGEEEIKPDFVFLPRLREFVLCYVSISNDYMEKLLFGCPSLENLSMYGCILKTNYISFPNLKQLTINSCSFTSNLISQGFSISAPDLEHLYFLTNIEEPVKLVNMSKVTRAIIRTCYDFPKDPLYVVEQPDYNCELLSSISGVQLLELLDYEFFKEMLENEVPNCPTFLNLKELYIGVGCMYCNYSLLSSFLEHCPNLEKLSFSHKDVNCWREHIREEQDQNLEQIEKFGCNNLRMVEIVSKRVGRDVDRLVRLLRQSTLGIEGFQIVLQRLE